MEISTFILEKEFANQGFANIIGTDEVGRGPLCGPVVAGATMFKDPNFEIPSEMQKQFDLIRDSKKLSEKQREEIFDFIDEYFYIGIGLCDHRTTDRINILEASFLAMKKAIQQLQRKASIKGEILILVDGNKEIPNFSHKQKAIIGGDRKSKLISASSIIAKVTRDRMMKEFAKQYPNYALEKNMGYGTKIHLEALKKYGPCPIHRRSFAPVKNVSY